MVQDLIHKSILNHYDKVEKWFQEKRKGYDFPFYSSFDLRDAGFKVTTVDANLFPAGFNNICQVDKESSPELARKYLDHYYANDAQKILLLTEEHTNNTYYWENVETLYHILQEAGREVLIGIPKDFPEPITVQTAAGRELTVHSAIQLTGEESEFKPDLIISNNDFSHNYENWAAHLKTPINPPREMGWYRRKKHLYFKQYNEIVKEFCQLIDIDPWILQVRTEFFSDFDIANEESREQLALTVEKMIDQLKIEYSDRGIQQDPTIFIKNNSGTYGLAVTAVQSGDEIRKWNYKSRKKMKAAKGGRDVEELIIQEGVPSKITLDEETAEPAIYLLGCELAGGFLRAHGKKGPTESLNSPGAVYRRLCVSDLKIDVEGAPFENVYGWIARLSLLAISREFQEMGVQKR